MMRLLAISTLSAALFSLSFQPWGSGYFAIGASFLLISALMTETKPWRGAISTGVAWTGLGLSAAEGTAAFAWWILPALVAMFSLGWVIAGALFVWLRRRLPVGASLVALVLLLTSTEFLISQRGVFGDAAIGLLAYTQADTPLKALAPWSGASTVVLGLLLIAAGAYALRVSKWGLAAWLVLPAIALVLAPAPGTASTMSEANLSVGSIQGSRDSLEQLLAAYDEEISIRRAASYGGLISEAVERGAELVVLGETVLPSGTDAFNLPAHLNSMLSLAPATIVGAKEYSGGDTFNSAFMWTGTGIESVYRKRALVPIIERGFERGESAAPIMSQGFRVGLAICLDTFYSELIRSSVSQGGELLIFITDDTFAGFTATPFVHMRTSALRAAETARATVFTNEWGPSAMFDTHGNRIAYQDMGTAGVIVAELPLGNGITPYVRFGDWVGWLTLAATIAVALTTVSRGTSVRRLGVRHA